MDQSQHAIGPSDRPSPRLHRRFLVAAVVWVACLSIVPAALADAWFLLLAAGTCAVLIRRARSLTGPSRTPTVLIVGGVVLSLVGMVVRGVHAGLSGTEFPFPSPADGFGLVAYVVWIFAILMIVHRRVPRLGSDPILDAIVAGIAAALLQWTVVLLPYLRTTAQSPSEVTLTLLYSTVALLASIAAVLALVAGSRPSTSNRLMAAALVAVFAGDTSLTLISMGVLPEGAGLLLSPIALVLGAMGLLHPSVEGIADRCDDQDGVKRLTRRRVSVLALALLTPPVLMLWVAVERGMAGWSLLPALASLALTPLVVTRLGRLVKQNEEMASLESALRSVGERLVSAETTEDVARVITVGAEQVLGTEYLTGGLVLEPLRHGAAERAGELSRTVGELQNLLTDDERLVTATLVELGAGEHDHVLAGLVVVNRSVRAALVVSTSREAGEQERQAIEALCREAAIAIRAVDQTELQVRQRSEERFGALIHNSSDIVAVLDEDLGLTYVSPVAARLLGYDELSGTSVMDLVHHDHVDRAHGMLDSIRFGHPDSVEILLRHAQGHHEWFEVVGVDLSSDPNIGGIVLNVREIGDRKRAEEQLLLSEARFKALVQNSSDLVVLADANQHVRYASPSLVDVVGIGVEAAIGLNLQQLFEGTDLDWTTLLRSDSGHDDATGPSAELVEFRFRNRSDEWRTIETSIADLRHEPAVGGYVLNARDVTDRKGMEQRLRYQATHDELTGLVNRVHVLDDLAGMLARNSGATTVAALLIGLDDFKDVNDSLGHSFGDRLLIAVAERITSLLGFGDVAARVGGDQFIVVLERSRGEAQVTDLTDQILSALALPFDIDGRELTVTASAGIVFDHDRTSTGEVLLRNADIAMYRAKTQGKRQVVVFEPQMHTASYDRLELRADLARAITTDQFRVHYQPVVDLGTHRIVGAEALVRWEHPERGMLGPNIFIPLAEETGLIIELGEWVLERACAEVVRWRKELSPALDDFSISVNLSVQQLHEDRIVDTVRDVLARTGLPAHRLVLEVTESTLITDTDQVTIRMRQLRELGIRFAVDDFGTGYSSLGYIQQFEFDVLKIDKSFVDGIDVDTNHGIVTAVLELAHQLRVRTVAEGIETEVQSTVLTELGCDLGQGYWFSRPVPEEAFRELLVSDRIHMTDGARI